MYGTTQNFTQAHPRFGSDYAALHQHAGATQREPGSRRKPPARYEAFAIVIMLLIVALMPLFSK